jgi:hypothetical protein
MKANNNIKELIDWIKKYELNFEYTIELIDDKEYVVCNVINYYYLIIN